MLGLKVCYGRYHQVDDKFNEIEELENKYGEETVLAGCREGNTNTVKRCFERGLSVNENYKNGKKIGKRHNPPEFVSPLYMAAYKGHRELAEYLIVECKVDVDTLSSKYSATPLYAACRKGHLKVAELILNNDSDPTIPRTYGLHNDKEETILTAAKHSQNIKVMSLIEDHLSDCSFLHFD